MPYYHVRLFYYAGLTPPKINHIDQTNLMEIHVVKEIVEPHLRGDSFHFGNRTFAPSDVADIMIKRTPEMVDINYYFINGIDVTDKFLNKSREGKRKARKGGKSEELAEELAIPKEVLEKLPQEIQKTIEGVKLCYEHDHADFCFMGIRKALSTAINIRFRKGGREQELYDINGEPYKLTKWIELAKQNRFFSAGLAKRLTKEVKVFGDVGSHDYKIDFHKEDVPSIFKLLRLALGRMYHEEEKVQKEIKRKPQKRSTPSAKYAFAGEKFDLLRFQTNLKALDGVSDSETRFKLTQRIRDQIIDLPYDGMKTEIKNAVMQLLLVVKKEIKKIEMRKLCLAILHIVIPRRDNEVNSKIKKLFLPFIEKNYSSMSIEEKKYAMDIQQSLYGHDPKFLKKLMLDSIEKWSQEEFDALYKKIEFDRLNQEYIEKFKILLWKLADESKKSQLEEKMKRVEKLLSLYVFR